MFNSKLEKLFDVKEKQKTSESVMISDNAFLKAGLVETSKTTSLGNGALKYITTGSDFVDQFGKISNYRVIRKFEDISKDMSTLWSQNKVLALALTFYIRMITRIVSLFDGSKTSTTQRGQGLKHEGIMRMIWIAVNAPSEFWKNIVLFISIGSWKDIFQMLSYDLQYNGWDKRVLDWDKFGQLILAGLENENTTNLVRKYLPQIKANSACTTIESQANNMIGKWIASLLFGNKFSNDGRTYKEYRKIKTNGTAHTWQQLISKGKFIDINFNSVHGRALAQLVSSKFLSNQGLESIYESWIAEKPVAKYTGFVYELMSTVKTGYKNNTNLKKYQIETINKQFYGLIETARNGMNTNSKFIIVVDSSSSMTKLVPGLKISSYDVAKSLALYFSYLLDGPFSKAFMEFANTCRLIHWQGSTPVENLQNDRCEAYGSTNFMSVADTFGSIKNKGVVESEFPTGIVAISDGCFNSLDKNKSNFVGLLERLKSYGFSNEYVDNFKVVLWDIPNGYYGKSQTAFEADAEYSNFFYMSGFDGAGLAFLTGKEGKEAEAPKNAQELFLAAMDQETLNMIEV